MPRGYFARSMVGLTAAAVALLGAGAASPAGAMSIAVLPTAYSQVATIAVGQAPGEVAISRNGRRAYVTNEDGGSVTVIDLKTRRVVATIRVGTAPRGVVVSPDNRRVYVANNGGDAQRLGTISVIDAQAARLLSTVGTLASPENLAISPDGSRLQVTGSNGSSGYGVADYALPALELLGYPLQHEGCAADGVAVVDTLRGTRTWAVTCPALGIVNVFDQGCGTGACQYPVLVGANPQGVAFDRNGNRAYVANADSDTVSVIDLATRLVLVNTPVGGSPYGVAVGRTKAFVTNFESDTVSVIDLATNTVVQVIPVGDGPSGVAVSPTSGSVYVTNVLSNTVSVLKSPT
ncbi:MAG: beta-propeller fold lactonase family protein [Actinomycetales bacterium]